jgi:hypothetical protein
VNSVVTAANTASGAQKLGARAIARNSAVGAP